MLFLRFGESSLEFELRVWISNIDQKLIAASEIHQEIDRRFRVAKIVIAFPQRDLHLHTLPEKISLAASTGDSDSVPNKQEPATKRSY